MHFWCCRGLFALSLVLAGALAACTQQPPAIDAPQALALLRTGLPLLACREDCVDKWRRAQPQAEQLDAAAHWPELATLVISVGYQDDLSLYYLGRAAEGLDYMEAAASYYRQSTQLSGTAISCEELSRVCGGITLPDAALSRHAAIEGQLSPVTRPRRSRTVGRTPEIERNAAPAVDAREAMSLPTRLLPATIPAAPPIQPTGPPVAGTAPSEFIEPPPAVVR
jgi:hypothetical protein